MKPFEPLAHPLRGVNLIEASAGTGKTFTITTLFLRLLLERQLAIGEILVVTYTNAATAELRARLRARLITAVDVLRAGSANGAEFPRPGAPGRGTSRDSAPDDEAGHDAVLAALIAKRLALGTRDDDLRRLTAAVHGFDDAAVFTIHGFCQRMLQEHAFESGAPFDAELVTDQRSLVREIVRDFWVRQLHDAPGVFIRFLRDLWPRPLEQLTGLASKVAGLRDVPVLPPLEDIAGAGDDGAGSFLRLQVQLVRHVREELHRRKEEANIQYFDDLLTRLRDALAGAGGELLADKIRQRCRAALIDEFQDTDPTQYEIFRRVYVGSDAPLFLIGDPKQAIYGFRGADVFTYVEAKDVAGPHGTRTLNTNRRSDPALLHAVNTLVGRARTPFVLPGIEFDPVDPAEGATDRLGGAYARRAPLQILYQRKGAKQIPKGVGRVLLYELVASEIARFLASGATIAGEAVRPNHIAVLCRTNDEARHLQRRLRLLRIPSVLQTDESVLETDEAAEVERVVRAMAEPGDSSAILAALSTPMLGVPAGEICALRESASGWDLWIGRVHRWHQTWLDSGFMPAYRAMLEECGVAETVLRQVGGERRMTNLLHLGEILQTSAAEGRRGPLALAEWLTDIRRDRDARTDALADAAQIRLEGDDLALELVTVHKSKGLEYPVVFCPFLWDGKLLMLRDAKEVRFHDPTNGNRLTLDIGSSRQGVNSAAAERESLAENLRLLYVALTRARHRCVLVWGMYNDSETSALGYLLHQDPTAPDDGLVEATRARIEGLSDAQMICDLEELVAEAGGSIEIDELKDGNAPPYDRDDGDDADLHCREALRSLRLDWRTSSFSALIAGGDHLSAGRLSGEAEEGVDRDDIDPSAGSGQAPSAGSAQASDAGRTEGEPVRLAAFPSGTRAGLLIHSVLENLDFGASQEKIAAVVGERLSAFGFEAVRRETLAGAVADVLRTPLPGSAQPFCLAEVGSESRLNELEFLFPVSEPGAPSVAMAGAAAAGRRFDSGLLASVFSRHAGELPRREYLERVRSLGFAPLSGYLKGYVDMVFTHAGLWYVVDYKSNHLGPLAEHYRQAPLIAAMEQHHYFLQYHLYAVALHRYLSLRLPDYDYDRHFGGVHYLFLRGMSPAHPAGNGVFFDRPPRPLIEGLSEALSG